MVQMQADITIAKVAAPLLDRVNGEKLQGMGDEYVVVPVQKWRDTSFWAIAMAKAAESFVAAGAMLPVHIGDDQVVVQEYHGRKPALAFIFGRTIAGEPHYHPHVFDLSPAIIAELTTAGRWKKPRRH